MKRPWPWILVGLAAYLIFVIATFPASSAYRWFAPPSVVLVAPSGSIWSGQAVAGAVSGFSLAEPKWNISPWQLALLRLGGTLEARVADGFAGTAFSVSPGGRVRLSDTRFSAGIQALANALPVFDSRGQISINLSRLVLEDNWPTEAAGEIRVGNLEVAPLLPTASGAHIVLGNFQADLATSESDEIVGNLSDAGGPLEIAGTISLRPDRSYLLDALVRPRPDASPELRQGIELMSGPPEDSSGMRELQLSGSF